MAHGGPDWGTEGPLSTIYSIQDLGELAARLGSIDMFDRRGNVFCLDSFDDGIEQWASGGNPAGWTAEWSAYHHKSGGFSAKLAPKAADDATVYMNRVIGYPAKSRIGIELAFITSKRLKQYDLTVDTLTGETLYTPYIRCVQDIGAFWADWQYLGSDNLYHNLTPRWAHEVYTTFHILKLVFDLITEKYVSLVVDTIRYDLSGHDLWHTADGSAPIITAQYMVTNGTALETQSYIDDFIATQNEP